MSIGPECESGRSEFGDVSGASDRCGSCAGTVTRHDAEPLSFACV